MWGFYYVKVMCGEAERCHTHSSERRVCVGGGGGRGRKVSLWGGRILTMCLGLSPAVSRLVQDACDQCVLTERNPALKDGIKVAGCHPPFQAKDARAGVPAYRVITYVRVLNARNTYRPSAVPSCALWVIQHNLPHLLN